MSMYYDARGQQNMELFTGQSNIMGREKKALMVYWFYTNIHLLIHNMLIDGLEWYGLLVDYLDVFNSCLDSHSYGTHSLQSELVN